MKMTEMPPHLSVKDDEKNNSDVDSDSSDVDDWNLPLVYDNPWDTEPIKASERVEHSWRVKEKYKTHCVALVMCLNIGVDPPDVVKTQPCARVECWIDPASLSPTKALEGIGQALQTQYERWQPRARYKQSLDPTSEEVKKLCCSLRRNAKDERVLFHYNGHGVPKPTAQGEIWVFNRNYTQYIPLSMFDLQTWMGAPSLYVYDCSNAGIIVDNFKMFAEQHERDGQNELKTSVKSSGSGREEGTPAPAVSYKNCIQLAACAAGQSLPMNPELPADLFTACLTTPVKMAMKWFVLRSKTRVTPHNVHDLIDKIPGQVTDRRTMLGELNWIFTAITDTIAWSSLPPDLFQQLFRADLLTASLCRNFLLADRIMRSYNCTPVSLPALPSLARHPLWQAWEHTLDLALAQLPAMLGPSLAPYSHSPFFRDQLTAFQVWLELERGEVVWEMPAQLPMVLQVLLSTLHRLRALQLLCRFLALGPACVRAVLHVGIFPYMLKLLQASAHDLRPSMVYIWAKIIAVDPSCQVDLVNAKGHKYFLSVLQDSTVDAEHRTLAAFVLAGIVDNYPAGQEAALQGSLISICLEGVWGWESTLRVWACVALGRVWRGRTHARLAAARDLAHEKLAPLLHHAHVQVRAACAFALGTYMARGGSGGGSGGGAGAAEAGTARSEHANAIDQQVAVTLAAALSRDCAAIVRCEILAALQWPVLIFEQHFIAVYIQERMRRSDKEGAGGARVDAGQDALGHEHARRHHPALCLPTIGFGSVYMKIWNTLCTMSKEPHPQISQMANDIINYIANQVDNVSREVEGVSRGSSLPGSPRPASHMPALGHRRGKSGLPNTISEESVINRDRDSTSSNSSAACKRGIVDTQWVGWVSRRVAGPASPPPDCEARASHVRVWHHHRNTTMRNQAKALRLLRVSKLDTQTFHSRSPLPPTVILFHPYEQHIAVANKDNFGMWDWGTAARLWAGTWSRAWGRVTALQLLNAHHRPLLVAASHTGDVAVYRAEGEGKLVTCWRGLHTRPPRDSRPPHAMPLYSGGSGTGAGGETETTVRGSAVLASWSSRRTSLALAGPADYITLWDLHTHLLQTNLPTESTAAVTALHRHASQLTAGLSDGAVTLWDERRQRPTATLRDHAQPVLLAQHALLHDTLVTASTDGEVRLYDVRVLSRARAVLRAPPPLAAAALHPRCCLLACGSVNQCISLYDLKGNALNTIKFHEGFMGARIGPVSCLTFHPLRVAMGVGSKDSTVSVYVSEPRR